MATLANLDGVRIIFYANEHPPPHFHARYAEHQAVIDIASLTIVAGFLPVVQRRKVLAWAATHQAQLTDAFARTAAHEKVEPIR